MVSFIICRYRMPHQTTVNLMCRSSNVVILRLWTVYTSIAVVDLILWTLNSVRACNEFSTTTIYLSRINSTSVSETEYAQSNPTPLGHSMKSSKTPLLLSYRLVKISFFIASCLHFTQIDEYLIEVCFYTFPSIQHMH